MEDGVAGRFGSYPKVIRRVEKSLPHSGLFLDADNRGFELSPTVLGQLADREIRSGFDIYAPESSSYANRYSRACRRS
jgi:hypothetical protein